MIEVTDALLERIVESIVEEVHPYQVYLFGSLAQGQVTADSDVDLLIIEDKEFGAQSSRWDELKRIRGALRKYRVPKDVLVYSRSEFEKWRHSINHIIARAVLEGRLLYERS